MTSTNNQSISLLMKINLLFFFFVCVTMGTFGIHHYKNQYFLSFFMKIFIYVAAPNEE